MRCLIRCVGAKVLTVFANVGLLLGLLLVVFVGANANTDLQPLQPQPKPFAAVLEAGHKGDGQAQKILAASYLHGIGVAVDRRQAMSWFCQLAHQPQGGREAMEGIWLLAEWFRTGGGLPFSQYRNANPDHEDPLRAYFWYGVLATQAVHYQQTDRNSELLGGLGRNNLARMLLPEEQRQLDAALKQWQPHAAKLTLSACLMLPEIPPNRAQ